jgi:salicylate hydroxylase
LLTDQIPTYPTGSLNFLHKLQDRPKSSGIEKAKAPLKIIISGAGLGGLATAIALARRGHQVTTFEQVEKLSEVCFPTDIVLRSNVL